MSALQLATPHRGSGRAADEPWTSTTLHSPRTRSKWL